MTYRNMILKLVLTHIDRSWSGPTLFIVSAYYEPGFPSGANLRFEGLRGANDDLQKDVAFIPNGQADQPVELRPVFRRSAAGRRMASLLLQIALRNHDAVFDAVPFLPFSRHYLLIHDSGNLFAGARRSGRLRATVFRAQLGLVSNFVTVSKATARALRLSGYRAPAIVSPNAVGFPLADTSQNKDIDFLLVSSGAHHKRDVQAYNAIRDAFPDASIVLAGQRIEQKLSEALDARAVFVNSPHDAQLAELFARTRTYVTWSRVEGFGMTVLEALASGCRCLVTDIPCFRELFRTFPQVAFLPTKGLDGPRLRCAWESVASQDGLAPAAVCWQDILLRLHADVSTRTMVPNAPLPGG